VIPVAAEAGAGEGIKKRLLFSGKIFITFPVALIVFNWANFSIFYFNTNLSKEYGHGKILF
jgi:hypothetical protein